MGQPGSVRNVEAGRGLPESGSQSVEERVENSGLLSRGRAKSNHSPFDAHLQMMLGLSFANSKQSVCCLVLCR
jgi:hypothetical protein